MAGEPADIPKLTGIQKHFNSYTTRGRANVAKVVYGLCFVGFLFYKLKPSKGDDKK